MEGNLSGNELCARRSPRFTKRRKMDHVESESEKTESEEPVHDKRKQSKRAGRKEALKIRRKHRKYDEDLYESEEAHYKTDKRSKSHRRKHDNMSESEDGKDKRRTKTNSKSRKDPESSESESSSESDDVDRKRKMKSRRYASSTRDERFDRDRNVKGRRDYMSATEQSERKRKSKDRRDDPRSDSEPAKQMKKIKKKKRVKIVESSSGTEESDYSLEEKVDAPKRNRKCRNRRKSLPRRDRKQSTQPSTEHRPVVGFKCAPHKVHEIVKPLNETQRGWVAELGFAHFLDMPNCRLPRAITLWLIDQVDWKKKTLVIRGKHIKIRKLVKRMLGVHDGRIEVPIPRHGPGKHKVRDPTEEEKEYRQESRGSGKPVKHFVDKLAGIMDREKFKKYFLLIVLCVYLAPASGHVMNRNFLSIVQNLDRIPEMDWCTFVADCIADGVRMYRESRAANINVHGCLHVLLVSHASSM